MELQFKPDDLRPLVREVVQEALAAVAEHESRLNTTGKRLGFSEAEAAALLGRKPYELGDARRRGQIRAKKMGKSYIYSRDTLLAFLGGE